MSQAVKAPNSTIIHLFGLHHLPPENNGYPLTHILLPVSSIQFVLHIVAAGTPTPTLRKKTPLFHFQNFILLPTKGHQSPEHSCPKHTLTGSLNTALFPSPTPPDTTPCLAAGQTLINPSLSIQQKCYFLQKRIFPLLGCQNIIFILVS